jgi:putative transposase
VRGKPAALIYRGDANYDSHSPRPGSCGASRVSEGTADYCFAFEFVSQNEVAWLTARAAVGCICRLSRYTADVPWGLKRRQRRGHSHFVTFSCFRREPLLDSATSKRVFERALERVRKEYGLLVYGYVVMPEHVHLLVSEPERETLAVTMQALKQGVARRLIGGRDHFWQKRYYDFNVFTALKFREKLRYIHRNPVKRGLVSKPEEWEWSSFRHYRTGVEGVVGIESEWTWRRRERMGVVPVLKQRNPT